MGRFLIKLLFLTVYFIGFSNAGGHLDIINAASAASIAVTSGASMVNNMAGAPGYSVVCTIEIENWTKYPLRDPGARNNGGQLKSSPVPVLPGKREYFVAHKTGHTTTGTYGTASWSIDDLNRRAVVMWSCPYNFNHYSNWLAVGLNSVNIGHRNWFEQMYSGKSDRELKFVRHEYYRHTKTISINDDKFQITGTMGTSHKARARIIVAPLFEDDLAPQIKAAMSKK